ncbi:MAG: class I SAM-dependent methyltransferase [Verrucomicrobiota bacterium]
MNSEVEKQLSPEARAAREKQFFDVEYRKYETLDLSINPRMLAKYSQPSDMSDWLQKSAVLSGSFTGRKLLEYGCGLGEEATYFAVLGADVCAIDVSETAITLATKRARHNGVAAQIRFLQVNGERLDFPDNYFDLVHGLGILHHVTLTALPEVHRVLKPGGRAVFLEHMGGSRHLVPALQRMFGSASKDVASEDEKPLDYNDVYQAGKTFAKCEVYPYHLLFRLRRLLPARLHGPLRKMDYYLLRLCPVLKRYAGGAIIVLIK